jgi:NADH-quinone oxidoreductase subunit M
VFGEVANENVAALTDVTGREKLILAILAIAVLALGVYPAPLIEVIEPTLANVLEQVTAAR